MSLIHALQLSVHIALGLPSGPRQLGRLSTGKVDGGYLVRSATRIV